MINSYLKSFVVRVPCATRSRIFLRGWFIKRDRYHQKNSGDIEDVLTQGHPLTVALLLPQTLSYVKLSHQLRRTTRIFANT